MVLIMEQGLHYLWNKYLKCLCYEGVHDEKFIGSVVFVMIMMMIMMMMMMMMMISGFFCSKTK